jgi:hypothetical protein
MTDELGETVREIVGAPGTRRPRRPRQDPGQSSDSSYGWASGSSWREETGSGWATQEILPTWWGYGYDFLP